MSTQFIANPDLLLFLVSSVFWHAWLNSRHKRHPACKISKGEVHYTFQTQIPLLRHHDETSWRVLSTFKFHHLFDSVLSVSKTTVHEIEVMKFCLYVQGAPPRKPTNESSIHRIKDEQRELKYILAPHGHNTRSSPYVTLIKPPSSLKVTDRFFRHASPHLWNQLPTSLRILHPNYSSPSQRPSFEHAGLTCYTPLSPSITFSLFHSKLKTYLFRKILSSTLVCLCLSNWSHGSRPFTGFCCSSVLCISFISFCFSYS